MPCPQKSLTTEKPFFSIKDCISNPISPSFKPGFKILGLAEDGVGWALDEHNSNLVSSAMKSKVEQVRKDKLPKGSVYNHS